MNATGREPKISGPQRTALRLVQFGSVYVPRNVRFNRAGPGTHHTKNSVPLGRVLAWDHEGGRVYPAPLVKTLFSLIKRGDVWVADEPSPNYPDYRRVYLKENP